jgi:two-component system phosphate regulon sensor histidine kinase PhoR
MPWVVALLVAVVAVILIRHERQKAKASTRSVADWTRHVVHTGAFPATGPISDVAVAEIANDLERIATKLEEARRDQSAEAASLQSILAGMGEGVMVVDSRHIIRRVNPSLVRFLDLKTDPLGQSVLRTLRDTQFDEIVTAVLKTGEEQNVDFTLTQSKPERHLAITATAIREASGENAVLLICHDVTRLRQLEDVRREFVANVSHELRTPLAIFQGYLENLLDNPDIPRPELVNVLEILKRHSTRLNAIVEDLLVLARLESRVQGLQLERIEPRVLIEDLVRDWQNSAQKKQITLTGQCAEQSPDFEADAFRIEQVLHNLIDNAIKHTGPGGRITLSVAPRENGIEFRIADTGIGINATDLPHIFERFYRADKARSRELGGTGLGLSIVKHIVQLHGGTVRAESIVGQGTTICIQLPLEAAPPPVPGMKEVAQIA